MIQINITPSNEQLDLDIISKPFQPTLNHHLAKKLVHTIQH